MSKNIKKKLFSLIIQILNYFEFTIETTNKTIWLPLFIHTWFPYCEWKQNSETESNDNILIKQLACMQPINMDVMVC